jgi:hypothetical protein
VALAQVVHNIGTHKPAGADHHDRLHVVIVPRPDAG